MAPSGKTFHVLKVKFPPAVKAVNEPGLTVAGGWTENCGERFPDQAAIRTSIRMKGGKP